MDNRHIPPLAPPRPAWMNQADGLASLDGALGTTLWCYLNNVILWATTDREARSSLFSPLSEMGRLRLEVACLDAPELRDPLITLASLLRAPNLAQPSTVATACGQISRWAEDRSLTLAACHFAEAAAYADADAAAHAANAGRLCRRTAQYARGAQWYERAYGLARRARSLPGMIDSLLGHGALRYSQGHIKEARRLLERAARGAENKKYRRLAADAYSDLLLLEMEEGGTEERGLEHASRAILLRSSNSARLPYLVHDIANWLLCNAYYAPAEMLLKRLTPYFLRPEEQAFVLGTHAHATAALGWRENYSALEQRVVSLATVYDEYGAAALVNLAAGARILRDWLPAEEYARLAVEIAQSREGGAILRRAQSLLRAVIQREVAPAAKVNSVAVSSLARRAIAKLSRRTQPEAL